MTDTKTYRVERDSETGRWMLYHVLYRDVRLAEPSLTVNLQDRLVVSNCVCGVHHQIPMEGLIDLLVAAGVMRHVVAVEEKP